MLTLDPVGCVSLENANGLLVGRDSVSSLCTVGATSSPAGTQWGASKNVLPGRYWLVTNAGFAAHVDVSPGAKKEVVHVGEAALVIRSKKGSRVQVVPSDADPFLRLAAARWQVPIEKNGERRFLLQPGSYLIVGEAGRVLAEVELPLRGAVVELVGDSSRPG